MSGQDGAGPPASGGSQPTKADGGEMDALLLGRLQELQDYMREVIDGRMKIGTAGPIALGSRFGWIISGPSGSGEAAQAATSNFIRAEKAEDLLQDLWSLEKVGITTIRHHLKLYEQSDPELVTMLKRDIYCDDLITSVDTEEEAEEVKARTQYIFLDAGMVMTNPSGKKYRSKPELARALGNAVDLTYFDFQTGKMSSAKKDLRMKKTAQVDYGRGIRSDALLVPPIRQTASIFKQPITLVKNFPDGKVKTDHKPGQQEKPKQLFWEKSLQGLRACDISEQQLIGVQLPRALRHVGPSTDDAVALQSLATALHSGNTPITGQAAGRQMLEKNPGVFMNPQQPLVQSICITEEDVRQQEERVCRARKTLENALGSLRP
ncbi:Methyl-CpG-binding domain protein 2 [Amphibalanus amphitrite]|uniref:Methyl-CpG-binding domain protein 2 n=1 Tax=Amphibalanus amphitrite TaxID=1232801 RepID=A0A6A4VQS5_AMPAM|nr:Methyl-CpG-binding domain protein 2 [Amphibalanus amphitrite]KAF0296556.1 Methyl-CpG-binding domain protein 2 [Amphibalanus amphitrite]